MSGTQLRQARRAQDITQGALAASLGVSQGYVSLLEAGERPVPPHLQKKLVSVLGLGPTALPLSPVPRPLSGEAVAASLGRLGYPGFAHRRAAKALNPAEVVLGALLSPELDARLAEGLVWLLAKYPDLDWAWLVPRVKQRDLQNRLGFLVELASQAASTADARGAAVLGMARDELERSRLDRDEPLSSLDMSDAERRWLLSHRPPGARRWRVLSRMRPEDVAIGTD